jgi:ABC-type multidrug transport system ATPase subunit
MEVELVCDRVVIMDKGRVIREGSIDELTPRTGKVHFELRETGPDLDALLSGVGRGYARMDRGFDLEVTDAELDLAIDRLRTAQIGIRSITQRRLTLEESFIDLVQRERA